MSHGIVRELAHDLEALAFVEPRRLEAVRVERQLKAVPAARDALSGLYQATANVPPAHVATDPERVDPERAAPAPAVDPADQCTLVAGLRDQQHSRSSTPVVWTLKRLISSANARAIARSTELRTVLAPSSDIEPPLLPGLAEPALGGRTHSGEIRRFC